MPDTQLLPKNFFKNNPLIGLSAANLAHFKMTVDVGAVHEELKEKGFPHLVPPSRQGEVDREKEVIVSLNSGEEIVSFMRSRYNVTNTNLLCSRAQALQAETLPLVLQRYRTSLQDLFIESAVQVLARAEAQYTKTLFETYDEIRNPYAQSMACLLFGVHHMEHTVPFLLKEHERMKREFPKKTWSQGPLLALYILYGKA